MRFATSWVLAVLAVLSLGTRTADAQEATDPVRVRLGVALGGAFGLAEKETLSYSQTAAALNPTLHVDLGLQISRQAAVYLRGEVGTIILTSQAAAYVIGEWTPVRWFSVGSGVGLDGMVDYCGCGNAPIWSAVSIPLLLGFEVWRRGHNTFRVGLEWAGGDEPSTGTLGWHSALTFGWALK